MYPLSTKFLLSSRRRIRFWGTTDNLPGLLGAMQLCTCPVCSQSCRIREDGLVPNCCGMLGAAESSPGAPAELQSPGQEPGRTRVPAAPCPHAAAGLGIGQQPVKALLCAFLSWQVKMQVNPGRGGPGDFPLEVKGANIPPPPAKQHPWGIQNAFHGQLSSSGVAVVGERRSPRHASCRGWHARSSPANTEEPWLSTLSAPAAGRGAGSAVRLLPGQLGSGRQGRSFLPLHAACPKPKMSREFLFSPCNCTARCELVATPSSSSSR